MRETAVKIQGLPKAFGANNVLRGVDLGLPKGQVAALMGANGAGKSTLVKVLCGVHPANGGEVRLYGEAFKPGSPAEAINAGVVTVPQSINDGVVPDLDVVSNLMLDKLAHGHGFFMNKRTIRAKARNQAEAIRAGVFRTPKNHASNAVIQGFDITKNIMLPFTARHAKGGFINRRSERTTTLRMVSELGILCQHRSDDIGSFSGGNQQKVMVGRWMAEASNVLVLDEPFQGVDIQARRDIGAKIRETAKGRATVVMVAEMDEAVEIADRIIVMGDHTIKGEHRNENIDLNAVLAQVAGVEGEQVNAG